MLKTGTIQVGTLSVREGNGNIQALSAFPFGEPQKENNGYKKEEFNQSTLLV